MKIFLDPGHGGQDAGCVANGIEEKTVNLSVALKLKPLLEAGGITVMLSRSTDVFPSLNERPSQANSWGADFFMSIHHNGGGGVGYEIYKGISGSCNDVAAKIAAEYEKLGRKPHNGGAQTKIGSDGKDYYAVIRDTNMPAILSEYCYLDSSDVNAINNDAGQAAEAQAIASGIFAHLGIKPVQATQTPLQPVNIVATIAPAGDPFIYNYQGNLNHLSILDDSGAFLKQDGACGTKTVQSLKRFELIVGVPQRGVWSYDEEEAYEHIIKKPELKLGSKDKYVVDYLQYRMGVTRTGVFDSATDKAVRGYQGKNGLLVDGICGALTFAKLIG